MMAGKGGYPGDERRTQRARQPRLSDDLALLPLAHMNRAVVDFRESPLIRASVSLGLCGFRSVDARL